MGVKNSEDTSKQRYILAFPPLPLRGGNFCPNWKTGKNLKEDLMKKGREKGGKEEKEKSDKTHLYEYL